MTSSFSKAVRKCTFEENESQKDNKKFRELKNITEKKLSARLSVTKKSSNNNASNKDKDKNKNKNKPIINNMISVNESFINQLLEEKVECKLKNLFTLSKDKEKEHSTEERVNLINKLWYYSYFCYTFKVFFGFKIRNSLTEKLLLSKSLRYKYSLSHYLTSLLKFNLIFKNGVDPL